ncbi:hypothetical protein FOMPIDRAFT_1110601 [Fomitopsis schrenkii]|uniref:Protein transport protein sec16 n=1 Tax=Fomitopsis schrenkii TaxID=2126942 RepID=S8ETE0_FOMSC|nr:hypothetical protein FOMPIDRAFT_1110601 [Fomitopsis schrenkii]
MPSHSVAAAYPRTQESSLYEPSRVASPPQRIVSPPIRCVLANGSATSSANYGSPYAPSHSATERSMSPGSASVRLIQNAQRQSFEEPHQGSVPKSPPTAPRRLITDSRQKAPANAYDPPLRDHKRAASPPTRVSPNAYDRHNPYDPMNSRMRSMSNGSALSSISAVLEDPYSPARHARQQTSDSVRSSFERGPSSVYTSHASVTHDAPAQVLSVPHPAQAMYAPSPSLLGANDPLGRTSVRIPVISFGFGGRLVTCFHGTLSSGGFDVALASRYSSEVKMQALNKVIPDSALDSSAASYPGPLFSDPGTPTTTSLVRTAAAQTKTKKARVIKYLEERAEELNHGLGYFHSGSLEGRRAEGKQILVKLLKVMVEHDGRLSGSPQIDAAVRSALSPRAAQPAPDALQLAASISGDIQSPGLATTSPYLSLIGTKDLTDTVVATHTLNSSHLDKIQEFLLKGERRAASHYASDQKLWAHAMVIASSIDKQAWKDVVTEFVRTELASQPAGPGTQAKFTDGREALRVAYSLFAGHGPASIQELASPKPLVPTSSSLQVTLPSTSSVTPVSASFSGSTEPMNIAPDVLAKWADTVAMIYSSPLTFETSSALTSLGDQLAASHWYEAAHACYLLSPQTSPIGGVGSSSRMVLLGSPSPSVTLNFAKDPDPLTFTEIAEFALSLTPPAKGQDAYTGLPHLQPYRLIKAAGLTEMGHVQLANRYCEAISNSLNKNSPYINATFLEQLKGLNDRLVAAPQLDKSGSWIASKVAKPSLDGIGSWVGGRLTKFIAGEDSPGPDQHTHGQQQQPFGDPFSQYSTISSTSSSAAPSPHQSTVNLAQTATNSPPPFRTGSAMGLRVSAAPQINRASSAMDYTRPSLSRRSSPVPRVASANPATTTFADASLYSQALNGHAFGSSSKQSLNGYETHDDHQSADSDSPQSNGPAMGSWWGSSDASALTPTASSFAQHDESSVPTATSGQFISLMDDYSATPTAYQAQRSFSSNPTIDEEDDDLGLGNNSSRSNRQGMGDGQKDESTPEPAKEAPKEEAKPKAEEKHASSSGWLSRLWKRESSTPAPIKANLGDSTSFYYDKELKRWVNKNSAAEATNSTPTAPPPRAQTASPGASMRALPLGATPPPPPPARPATTDPGDGMPKPPMRIRSNLVPPESDRSAPPTPMSATLPGQGPPQSRSRPAAKKPARSRYVDVFAQQQST